jgi:Xaa-Pro aminopeptidase
LIIGPGISIIGTDPRYELEARHQAKGFYPFIYRKGLEDAWGEIGDFLKPLKRVAIEGQALTVQAFQRLKRLFQTRNRITLVPTQNLVEELRTRKESSELKAISRSLAITEKAFQKVVKELKPGMKEKELAWRIKYLISRLGGDDIAFEPIVASGPRAAQPHAESTEREIKKEEPILFDLGARLDGYCSDLSRTVWLGKPSDRFQQVYRLVREAQRAAEAGMRAGLTTTQVDEMARSVINKGGYGEYFNHSLGHGVGLATHEAPSLSPAMPSTLLPGMVVTIEPGIYLPGWGGVRLENLAVVRDKGATILNRDQTFYHF